VARFTRNQRDDKWHEICGTVKLPSDKMRCPRNRRIAKRRNNRIRNVGGVPIGDSSNA
jgi:hypothetical protein